MSDFVFNRPHVKSSVRIKTNRFYFFTINLHSIYLNANSTHFVSVIYKFIMISQPAGSEKKLQQQQENPGTEGD